MFEGLAEAGWWRQLAREVAEQEDEYEWDPFEESSEEPEVAVAADERAAQSAMSLQTGGRIKYGKAGGELVLRRVVGQLNVEWGSARRDELVVVEGGRRSRAARRRGRQHQPQQTSAAGAASASGAVVLPLCVPPANLLAQNKFAALAVVDEAGESEEELGPEETPCAEEAAYEEGAAKELEVLLTSWAASCPAFGGSARQAARQEIEAMVAWLPSLLSLHPGAAWQAAIVQQLHSCEEAWLCLSI